MKTPQVFSIIAVLLLVACVSSAGGQVVDKTSISPTFAVSSAEESALVVKAEAGDVRAMIDLHIIHSEKPDGMDEGFFWLLRAADAGDERSRKLAIEILERHDDDYKRGMRLYLTDKWTEPK